MTWTNLEKTTGNDTFLMTEALDFLMTQNNDYILTKEAVSYLNETKEAVSWTNLT